MDIKAIIDEIYKEISNSPLVRYDIKDKSSELAIPNVFFALRMSKAQTSTEQELQFRFILGDKQRADILKKLEENKCKFKSNGCSLEKLLENRSKKQFKHYAITTGTINFITMNIPEVCNTSLDPKDGNFLKLCFCLYHNNFSGKAGIMTCPIHVDGRLYLIIYTLFPGIPGNTEEMERIWEHNYYFYEALFHSKIIRKFRGRLRNSYLNHLKTKIEGNFNQNDSVDEFMGKVNNNMRDTYLFPFDKVSIVKGSKGDNNIVEVGILKGETLYIKTIPNEYYDKQIKFDYLKKDVQEKCEESIKQINDNNSEQNKECFTISREEFERLKVHEKTINDYKVKMKKMEMKFDNISKKLGLREEE